MAKTVKSLRTNKPQQVQTRHGFCTLSLEKLVKASWNYKMEDEALSAKLLANLKRNGQIENLVVRELPTGFYEIVNGNHRYDVLQHIARETGSDEVMCYNLGSIGEAAAQRIAIELNETRYQTDTLRLSELLNEISEFFTVEDMQSSLPYSPEELERLMKLQDYNWEQFNELAKDAEAKSDNEKNYDDLLTIRFTPLGKEAWEAWKQHCSTDLGLERDEDVFERACREALSFQSYKAE